MTNMYILCNKLDSKIFYYWLIHLSVIHSVHKGGWVSQHALQVSPGGVLQFFRNMDNVQLVRILLECILVSNFIFISYFTFACLQHVEKLHCCNCLQYHDFQL